MIKTVFIDVDNTLLDFDKCATEAMELGFGQFGLEFVPVMFDTFTRINNSLWQRLERGELTLDGLHAIRWNTIFDSLGINADGVAFEQVFHDSLAKSAIPVDGAIELLQYLSKRYNVCAASNGPYGQQCYRLEKAGMTQYMKEIFVSEKAGFSKPTKEFFDYCFNNMEGVKKEDVILIGDSPSADIAGGVAYGLKTIWYNHNRLPLDAAKDYDYVVGSLNQITDIL